MKVKELIALLQKENPEHDVVMPLHSEHAVVITVDRIVGYDNGGYVSVARTEEQKLREHGYVRIDT